MRRHIIKKIGQMAAFAIKNEWVAEAQGFEPWEDFHPRRFSRPVHSTTLPSLRWGGL